MKNVGIGCAREEIEFPIMKLGINQWTLAKTEPKMTFRRWKTLGYRIGKFYVNNCGLHKI